MMWCLPTTWFPNTLPLIVTILKNSEIRVYNIHYAKNVKIIVAIWKEYFLNVFLYVF